MNPTTPVSNDSPTLQLTNLPPLLSPLSHSSTLPFSLSNSIPDTAGITSSPSSPSSQPHLLASTSPLHDIRANCLPCDGIHFKWENKDSFFLTYPLQYHENNHLDWSLDAVGEPGSSNIVRIRSHHCSRSRDPRVDACLPCKNVVVSRSFQNMLKNTSKDPSPYTPHKFLNWKQLEERLKTVTRQLQLERKQVSFFC